MNKLLYYGHWTDKRKYIPYISVTQKVVKSCGSKMATCYMMYIMYDVHKASSLYKKTCRQSFFMYNFFFIVFFPFFSFLHFDLIWLTFSLPWGITMEIRKVYMAKVLTSEKHAYFPHPPWKTPSHQIFIPLFPSQIFKLPPNKNIILAVVLATVPFLAHRAC